MAKPASALSTLDIRRQVSPEEWSVRLDLAAAYRLVALYGWDDMIFMHLSARVPGPAPHFLIKPFGFMFDEITASSLVKIDVDATKLGAEPDLFGGLAESAWPALRRRLDRIDASYQN